MLRPLLLAAACAAFIPPAAASTPCDDACRELIREGHAFAAKGQYQEALGSFEAAHLAKPLASPPLAAAALLLQDLSKRVAPDQVAELRGRARAAARRALELDADDPLAQEALRQLDEDAPSPLRRAPFDIELAAWRYALRVIEKANAASGESLRDPALRQMQAFAKDGQLEPALLLLTYRQSYRPALEAWLAREPRGPKEFIDRYGVRP
ncbi:hypothetical protein [Massilia sp. GCM10023247]|uniref:hypothetical protein n=1 Tax=Massilia sp. GCM10023247 TaxID=3252643 RepID=UPI00361135BF